MPWLIMAAWWLRPAATTLLRGILALPTVAEALRRVVTVDDIWASAALSIDRVGGGVAIFESLFPLLREHEI